MFIKARDFKITKIRSALFWSFAFILPVSQKISTINIILLLLVSLFSIKKNEFYLKKEFLLLISLYLIYCTSLFYSSEFQVDIIERKASLIAFPVIFLCNLNFRIDFNKVLKYFVIGCAFALFICELNAISQSLDFTNLAFNTKANNELSLYNSIIRDENFFFTYKFSFLHQTVYFAMYLSLAIVILLYKKVFKTCFNNILLCFFFIGVFQILNKASIIVLVVILTMKLFLVIKNKRNRIFGIILLSSICALMFVLNPRFNSFNTNFNINESEVKIKDFKKIPNDSPNNTNFRVMLWVSSLELIKENPYFGIGAGGSHNRLYEVFAVKRQWFDKSEKYHAHNQYLQIFLDIGIVGFLIFSLLLFYFIKCFNGSKDRHRKILAFNFIVIIGINFLFESMFERYSGLSFFCFFYCLFVSWHYTNLNYISKNNLTE